MRLFMFPGQGSQKPGMGKDLYDAFAVAKSVFHQVDDAISFKLSDLIFCGTEEDLLLTKNSQPALMAVSIAYVEVLKREFGIDVAESAKFCAGHSLGEYTALCATGAISLSDTAKILRLRGEAMAAACPTGGAMVALLGLNVADVEQIIAQFTAEQRQEDRSIVQIANDNAPGQVIISGHVDAVQWAAARAIEAGAKKTVPLNVSGPFHSSLMEKAADKLANYLEFISFGNSSVPIIANFTAKAEISGFKELLLKQITGRVRWRESILFAKDNGVSECIEVGSEKVLTGLVKRISPDTRLVNINSAASLNNITLLISQEKKQ
jgi:[acyl-carrier-protein] S-malonyltransferase